MVLLRIFQYCELHAVINPNDVYDAFDPIVHCVSSKASSTEKLVEGASILSNEEKCKTYAKRTSSTLAQTKTIFQSGIATNHKISLTIRL